MARICDTLSIPKLLSPEECEKISAYASTFTDRKAEITGGPNNQVTVNPKIRKCELVWFNKTESLQWLFDKIEAAFRETNNTLYQFDLDHLENIQFTRYKPRNFFHEHFDNSTDSVDTRKLTISIQLTDPKHYLGGNLKVRGSNGWINAPKNQGDALIFPPYLLHKAETVWFGRRECLVAWMNGLTSFK